MCSLKDRVKYSAIVVTFLAIWRNWIIETPKLTLKTNFISRETFIDTLTSCHFAVSLICYCRDNFSSIELHLEESGTDCCESYFSNMGQWVGNKHNYSFADMRRNQSHCIRLDQIRADPNNGVKFAKPHPKGESIWEKQYDSNFTKPNLKDYPSSEEVVASWKEGIVLARELAISVGMKPSKDQPNLFPPYQVENTDHWFFDPLSTFKVFIKLAKMMIIIIPFILTFCLLLHTVINMYFFNFFLSRNQKSQALLQLFKTISQ